MPKDNFHKIILDQHSRSFFYLVFNGVRLLLALLLRYSILGDPSESGPSKSGPPEDRQNLDRQNLDRQNLDRPGRGGRGQRAGHGGRQASTL